MDAQPKKFKFTLTALGEDNELKNAPDGWMDTQVEFKRSATYQGVIRTLTLPLTFVYKGAGILRQVFYNQFLLGIAKITIDKLNSLTWGYINIFKGKVDFTQIEDDIASVKVNAIEDSFSEKISAYDDVKYQIPIDIETTGIEVELTPIPFKETADIIFLPTSDSRSDCYFGTQVVNNEQHAKEASVRDTGFLHDPNLTAFNIGNGQWFYKATMDTTLFISGSIKGAVTNVGLSNPTRRYQINVYKSVDTLVKTLYDVIVPNGTSIPFNISFDFTIDFNKDDVLFFYFQNLTDDNSDNGFNMQDGELHLSYNTQTPSTLCKGIRAYYVYDKLIQLMNGENTGGAYIRQHTQSYLLSGLLFNLIITCSNSIRKIVNGTQYSPGDTLLVGATYLVINHDILYNSIIYTPGEVFTAIQDIDSFTSADGGTVILQQYQEYLNLSFKDFFQAIRSVMGGDCGFGLDNNVATLEPLSNFFRNINMMDLGTIPKNPKRGCAIDYVFNTIKIGYEDQQYDTLNGFQEVNSTQYYTSDLTVIKKELDLVSPIRADAYGIESLRVTPQDTAASRSDNDNFFIWLKDAPEDPELGIYQPLRGTGLISISGVDVGTAFYNWMLTPKRNLLRGKSYLASVFWKQFTIRFTNGLKNTNLITVATDGSRVDEHSDITISDLGSPTFIPITFDITTELNQDALNQMNVQYGAIAFTYRNTQFAGFIIETSVDAGSNSQRDFKLLSSPNNNFNNLIY